MAFCKNCGTELNEEMKHCPGCGAPTEDKENSVNVGEIVDKLASLNNTPDTTSEFEQSDIEENKIMAVLAYLSWLVLIPLFAASKSKFAYYHCNQGIVLWIFGIVASVLGFLPLVGKLLGGVVGIVTLVLSILGIVNAATGKAKELPIVGSARILK